MENEIEDHFRSIIKKYNEGTATKDEVSFLEAYYNTFELKDGLITDENEADFNQLKYSIKEKADTRINDYNRKKLINVRRTWLRYAAAAVIVIGSSVLLFIKLNQNHINNQVAQVAQVIHPGGNKAMLTLSNGTKIMLDDTHKGEIAKESNVSIKKTATNQIIYVANNQTGGQKAVNQLENTITTPRGGQYELVLPDGSKVMLNAASSLTYPTAFQGKIRLVKLEGEAYFEVAKNKKMPFRVMCGVQTVEVLGTHFNINSYQDEAAIKTTLLEGSVKVSSGNNAVLIVPGQQSVVNRSGAGEILKKTVDVDKETAWKNGLFSFQNDDLKTIMRQVARWYDVQVVYADNLPHEKFIGEIPRSSDLSDVFKILELNNVHFDVKGKIVTVSAK